MRLSKVIVGALLSGMCLLLFQNCEPTFEAAANIDSNLSSASTSTPPNNCFFDGKSLANGDEVQAFQNSTVPFGASCVNEIRTCNDGDLSGSYNFTSCATDAPAVCRFNGATVAHGATVMAYQNSTVPYGSNCVVENRVCSNGALSGSYNFATCQPAAAQSCLFDGRTIPNGESVVAYKTSTVLFGETCLKENRTCANGSLSGSFTFASCNPNHPRACQFNSTTVAHGQKVKAYLVSNVAYDQICATEDRTCNDGTLSGSYSYASCTPNVARACMFNGTTIAHGQSVPAYASASVSAGSVCEKQNRLCTDGTLSGSFAYSSCVTAPSNSCTFAGNVVLSGHSVQAYALRVAPTGTTCVPQARTCTDGSLSGTNPYPNCSASNFINGFEVRIVGKGLQASRLTEVIDRLHTKLDDIVRLSPRHASMAGKVKFWITDSQFMQGAMTYHPSAVWLSQNGMDPAMEKGIEMIYVNEFVDWTVPGDQPMMVMHELTHSYHDQVLGWGNTQVISAYNQAKASGKYNSVRYRSPSGPLKVAYAMSNEFEYLAELTEAYFGMNDHYPFSRSELQSFDPIGYQLMQNIWGP